MKRNLIIVGVFLLVIIALVVIILSKTGKLSNFSLPGANNNIPKIPTGQLILKTKTVPLGFANDGYVFASPYFTGVITKVSEANNILAVGILNPLDNKTYTFHFATNVGIAEVTDPNSLSITWNLFSFSQAKEKLLVGKYITIKFNSNADINSISELQEKENTAGKLVVLYNYLQK